MRVIAVQVGESTKEDNISTIYKCIKVKIFVEHAEPITVEELERLTIFLETYKS